LLASLKVAYRIANCKKPHLTGESATAIDVV